MKQVGSFRIIRILVRVTLKGLLSISLADGGLVRVKGHLQELVQVEILNFVHLETEAIGLQIEKTFFRTQRKLSTTIVRQNVLLTLVSA